MAQFDAEGLRAVAIIQPFGELLAWNLRHLRMARALSQERLAVDAGVARGWLSQLERQKGNTSLDLLDRLAAALDVPVAALLTAPEAGAAPPSRFPTGASWGTVRPAEPEAARRGRRG